METANQSVPCPFPALFPNPVSYIKLPCPVSLLMMADYDQPLRLELSPLLLSALLLDPLLLDPLLLEPL